MLNCPKIVVSLVFHNVKNSKISAIVIDVQMANQTFQTFSWSSTKVEIMKQKTWNLVKNRCSSTEIGCDFKMVPLGMKNFPPLQIAKNSMNLIFQRTFFYLLVLIRWLELVFWQIRRRFLRQWVNWLIFSHVVFFSCSATEFFIFGFLSRFLCRMAMIFILF